MESIYLKRDQKKQLKIKTMKIYQVLKVTKEGRYFVKTCSTLKSAINWAKKIVANADVAPAEYQCVRKRKLEDGYFYASVRLMHNGYAIDTEIWKTQVHYEQTSI